MSIAKKLVFYAIFGIISLVIALIIAEFFLRTASFSSGAGAGEASKRWFEKYWHPINSLGYRDYEIKRETTNPTVVFIGDSFTAGHGVQFDETYYFKFQKNAIGINSVNLGKNGASTLGEIKSYKEYLDQVKSDQKYLVHQYFGNDIEDYIKPINIEPNKYLAAIGKYSELANLIHTLLFVKKFSIKYVDAVQEAYRDKQTMQNHLRDIRALHKIARESKASVVLVAFPFLNDLDSISLSSVYIDPIRDDFLENCNNGDFFVDVTPLARSFSNGERVVNSMDAHPSAKLHEAVSLLIQKVVSGRLNDLPNNVYSCTR